MAFSAIVVAPIGGQADPFAYPITDEECNVIEEKLDHGLSNVVTATSIFFSYRGASSSKQVIQGLNLKVDFYVTDSRVVLLCEKYDKGSSWSGGLAALALDAASSIAAAARRKGKVMLGHIRYEWISEITYNHKGHIGISYKDGDKNCWTLGLLFKKATDTEFVANEILRRTCAYRLAMTDQEEKERHEGAVEFFVKYSTGGRITPTENPKKESSRIQIPYSFLAPGGQKFRPGTQQQENE